MNFKYQITDSEITLRIYKHGKLMLYATAKNNKKNKLFINMFLNKIETIAEDDISPVLTFNDPKKSVSTIILNLINITVVNYNDHIAVRSPVIDCDLTAISTEMFKTFLCYLVSNAVM